MPAINLELSEGDIKNALAVAIAEAFSPDKRDAMLRDLIRAHLNYKENSYDKETLLSKTVGQQVRGMALAAVSAKVGEMRPEVEAMTAKMLGPSFKATVLDALETALQRVTVNNLHISVSFPSQE